MVCCWLGIWKKPIFKDLRAASELRVPSVKTGPQLYRVKEVNSVNILNKLGSGFFPRASKRKPDQPNILKCERPRVNPAEPEQTC